MTVENPIAAAALPEFTQSPTPDAHKDLRSELIARFEKWVDQMLLDEPPPPGLPETLLAEASSLVAGNQPAPEPDTYTLFSALTTLTGEIRLQGRAFKQLTDLLAPLAETPAMLAQLRDAQIESAATMDQLLDDRTQDPDAFPIQFEQVCAVMIDLYDRLQRGLQTCDDGIRSLRDRPEGNWLRRVVGGQDSSGQAIASVQAIRDASTLTLARLQAALQDWGVQRIGRAGEPFDPDRMSVVDVRAAADAEPGTVLAVNRSGYALNGVLKAAAQVTVSKLQI